MRYLSLFSGIEAASLAWQPLGWEPVAFSEVDRFCCELLRQRFPDVPNLGDVTAPDFIDRAKALGPIDLVVGGTPCFPDGALVLCRRGFVPIEDVVAGDEVLTHAGRYQRVCKVGSRMSSTVIVKGQGHEGLEVTSDHPILSRSFRRSGWKRDGEGRAHPHREWSEPEWTPSGEMFHRFWAQPSSFPATSVPPIMRQPGERIAPVFSPAFWWMVGAYLGNGWTRSGQRSGRPKGQEHGSVIICAGPHKADDMEAMLAPTGLAWTRTSGRTAVRFVTGSRALRRWMEEHFGKHASGKTVPAWMLGQPEAVRRAVIAGYAATDGSERENRFSATTVSRRLAYGLKMLWQSLGRSVSVSRHVPRRKFAVIEGRVVNELPQYHVTAYRSARSSVEIDGMRYGCVRKVLPGRTSTLVHNLEVEGDESYTVDGIAVHNCQSFSVAGLRKGLHDDRGNLTLRFVEVVHGIDPEWVVWENVPGVLNHSDNPFGCFLAGMVGADAALVPPGRDAGVADRKAGAATGRWTGAGFVDGPRRTAAFRILDAQWFRVPQRRRRVFVVSGRAGDFRCGPLLLESPGVRRDPPTRRAKGEGTTHDVAPCLRGRSNDSHREDSQAHVACFGGGNTGGAIDVATARSAKAGSRDDFDSETFVAQPMTFDWQAGDGGSDKSFRGKSRGYICDKPGRCRSLTKQHVPAVVHSLRADGFDASEDGIGRGTPLVPCPGFINPRQLRNSESSNQIGIKPDAEVADALNTDGPGAVMVPVQCNGSNVGTELPCLRRGDGGMTSGVPAIAFHATQDPISGEVSPAIGQGNARGCGSIGVAMAVQEDNQNGVTMRDTAGSLRSDAPGTQPCGTLVAMPAVAVSLRGREGGGTAEIGGEQSCAVRASQGGGDKPHVLCGRGNDDGHAEEAGPVEALRALRGAFGEEAFCIWCLGVLAAFRPKEVLRSAVHGEGVRRPSVPQRGLLNVALARSQVGSVWSVRDLWDAGCDGYPPQGSESCEQLAGQLGAYLSELPHAPAPSERLLRCLWRSSEGSRLLQEALSAVEEARRSECAGVAQEEGVQRVRSTGARDGSVREALHAGQASPYAVRRLVPEETEALQGMPRGWTLITVRGKPAADGPRYKSIRNSMAVPCMRWIGERIASCVQTKPDLPDDVKEALARLFA